MRRWVLLAAWGVGLAGAGCFQGPTRQTWLLEEDGGTTTTTTTGGAGGGDLLAGGGGTGGGPGCLGACVTGVVAPFEGLSVFQSGEPGTLAACADHGLLTGFEGHADMKVEPYTCPSCACSPAACALPAGMHANAAKCPGDGAASLPFGPAGAGWEGTCDDANAIPGWLQCSGVPCVQSLSVPEVVIEACKPSEVGDASPPLAPSWGKMVRECLIGPLSGEGCELGEACVPTPPDGFALCLFMKGDDPAYECPAEYPHREVYHAGVKDDRGCEACSCGPPEGAQCAAFVEAFVDAACGSPVASATVTDGEAACVDVPSGSALGSVEVSLIVDEPGSCAQSGGKPSGGITPAGPLTLCCHGDPGRPR